MATGTALVAGAAGSLGDAVSRELEGNGWTVRGLSRRRLIGHSSIQAGLTDAEATAAMGEVSNSVDLFCSALALDPDPATEAARTAPYAWQPAERLEEVGTPLERVIIYQGFKIYGIHLGAKVPRPAHESDPPHMPPNL